MAEFADNDLFSNTEVGSSLRRADEQGGLIPLCQRMRLQSLIIQLSVKECVIKADDKRTDYDLAKIRTMLERCGVIMTEVRASEWHRPIFMLRAP